MCIRDRGVGCSLVQQRYGLIRIPAETFLLRSYPVVFRPSDLLLVVAAFAAVAYSVSRLTVYSMIKKRDFTL